VAAAEWLQDCGWFPRDALPKSGGRPRSDFLMADGLWAALDEHARQHRQNRQYSAAGDRVEGSVDFGGFVGKDQENEMAPDHPDDDLVDPANDHHRGDGIGLCDPSPAPETSVLVLLDRMMAKSRAIDQY
jgi:hypothetical protein